MEEEHQPEGARRLARTTSRVLDPLSSTYLTRYLGRVEDGTWLRVLDRDKYIGNPINCKTSSEVYAM